MGGSLHYCYLLVKHGGAWRAKAVTCGNAGLAGFELTSTRFGIKALLPVWAGISGKMDDGHETVTT